MTHQSRNRGGQLIRAGAAALMIAAFGWGGITHAQSMNNPPHIASEPLRTITAGETYTYKLLATDPDTDVVSYSLTTAPEGMTLSGGTITWKPESAGTYNVVVDATDSNDGYDTQAWQVSVQPGAISRITIIPNERPTIVEIGTTQKFTASAYDAYDNELSDTVLTWTTEAAIGVVDEDGLFSARKGGIGFVAAAAGDIQTSIGVVVKDTRTEQVTPTANANTNTAAGQAAATDTNTAVQNPAPANTNTADPAAEVLGEQQPITLISAADPATTDVACRNWSLGTIFLSLFVYLVVLGIYYSVARNQRMRLWWIFPILLTAGGVMLYYWLLCADSYIWWPWVLIAFGVLLTWYHKTGSRASSQGSQTELPF